MESKLNARIEGGERTQSYSTYEGKWKDAMLDRIVS
jgi:hypothetical protein